MRTQGTITKTLVNPLKRVDPGSRADRPLLHFIDGDHDLVCVIKRLCETELERNAKEIGKKKLMQGERKVIRLFNGMQACQEREAEASVQSTV